MHSNSLEKVVGFEWHQRVRVWLDEMRKRRWLKRKAMTEPVLNMFVRKAVAWPAVAVSALAWDWRLGLPRELKKMKELKPKRGWLAMKRGKGLGQEEHPRLQFRREEQEMIGRSPRGTTSMVVAPPPFGAIVYSRLDRSWW
jgi:hypothetical protein